MRSFLKVAEGLDVLPLQLALQRQPEIFDAYPERRIGDGSPHAEMTDIWLRYNDRRPYDEKKSLLGFNDEHDSVWYPASAKLPEARPIIFGLMARVEGERLGAVLITKLPPGGRIAPHIDPGWHAGYYDKYYVAVKNDPGAYFAFDDGRIAANTGDVYWFRNDVPHWVVNESNDDRIAMIVCVKHTKGPAW